MTDLGVVIGDVVGEAYSINNRGQVVGYSISDVNDINTSHALLWRNGVMTVLQTRIPAGSGWTLLQAGRGQIEGSGLHNGVYRAFLLTPVP